MALARHTEHNAWNPGQLIPNHPRHASDRCAGGDLLLGWPFWKQCLTANVLAMRNVHIGSDSAVGSLFPWL